jgi:hypothetical protein
VAFAVFPLSTPAPSSISEVEAAVGQIRKPILIVASEEGAAVWR